MAAQKPTEWWVTQEGLLGDLVNTTVTGGALRNLDMTWHVVSGATKPNASAHGPYPSKAAAQAEANTLNSKGPGSDSGSVFKQGAEAAVSSASPIGGLFQASLWLRVAEVVSGLILIGIGLNAMLKGKPLTVVTSAAGKAGKLAMLA